MPQIAKTPPNFLEPGGFLKARARFSEEIKKGRMLGGLHWSRKDVEKMLGRRVYVIPCGAVPKNDDPFGRIIHNYSYPSAKYDSVNSALENTAVKYLTFKARVKELARVDWYVKADLKNGYRQLPVHPTDWHTQVYSLGPCEFYVDLNMPFGKSNSSKVFCAWSEAWCQSFRFHFQNRYSVKISLSVYIDDFFGGPIRTNSAISDKYNAKLLLDTLIEFGKITNTNMNVVKCKGPAKSLIILGMRFDSRKKACFLSPTKAEKYKNRLRTLIRNRSAYSKDIEKVVGNLVYAAWVIPFGRPFISHISHMIDHKNGKKMVFLDTLALRACKIWIVLINHNRGLSFDFIAGKLPLHKNEWFVDASDHGFGGICGNRYFMISYADFMSVLIKKKLVFLENMFIAYRELLAALFAFHAFSELAPASFIRLNSDNTNTVGWLNKGRCSKNLGFLFLAAIEFYKYVRGLKAKAFYIKSSHNTSADALSRGQVPRWLEQRGVKVKINIAMILKLIDDPVPCWNNL